MKPGIFDLVGVIGFALVVWGVERFLKIRRAYCRRRRASLFRLAWHVARQLNAEHSAVAESARRDRSWARSGRFGGQAIPPWDDYWYSRPGWGSAAGMDVTPESAMKLAAVFACVRVRSESLSSCPLIVYKRLPNGGKVRAPEHPLYQVLHNSPNQWQTSIEFVEMMQAHLDLRGNAFAHRIPGPRGAIDQLVPLHPDLVQVYRLPSGALKYQVRSRFTAEVDWYMQEEIFHLRGLSSDGLVGLSPIAVQRETMGTGSRYAGLCSKVLRERCDGAAHGSSTPGNSRTMRRARSF